MLAACTASSTCPNIIQVDADSEYYGAHVSLILTDTSGQALELPPNVRYWMLATAHLQGNAGCRDAANPVQPWPYYRAAFDAMVQWVRNGVEPPATRAPSVADGTAVTVERQGEQYPTIQDRPYNPTISELGVRDFSVWPPKESEERYPLFVPNLDADGNLVTGVMVPEVNPVQPWPYYRAAFDAMVQWVRNGVEPPATRAPSVADGTAVTVERQGEQYPTIQDRPYNPTISELGVRDFSVWPPKESEERYPLFVPNLDADGNLVTGVMVPEVAAPLATMGKAIRAAGFAEGDLCGVNGSTIPFPRTKDERMELGDSRLSLEERYPGGEAEYVKRYGEAADALVAERYLLPADAEILKKSAAAAWSAAIAAPEEDAQ